jgi:hypothetical protein
MLGNLLSMHSLTRIHKGGDEFQVISTVERQLRGASRRGREPLDTDAEDKTLLGAASKQCREKLG